MTRERQDQGEKQGGRQGADNVLFSLQAGIERPFLAVGCLEYRFCVPEYDFKSLIAPIERRYQACNFRPMVMISASLVPS
jgi:hypothetical protein